MTKRLRSVLTYNPYNLMSVTRNPSYNEMRYPLTDFLIFLFLGLDGVVTNLNGENKMILNCEKSLSEIKVEDRTIEKFIEIAKKEADEEIVGLLKFFLPGNKYSFLVSGEEFDTDDKDNKRILDWYQLFFGDLQ